LLVAQFEQALDRRPEQDRRLGKVTGGRINFDLHSQARVRVTVYRLNRLYCTHTDQLLDEHLAPGIHTVHLGPRIARAREAFVGCEQTTTRARRRSSMTPAPRAGWIRLRHY
jgi:hypothetical protein